MMKDFVIGIDLALKANHRGTILDKQKNIFLDKTFSFNQSFEGFEKLLEKVKSIVKDDDVKLIFVMEPTGKAWIPLSSFLTAKGYLVHVITTQQSSDMRKFMNKSNKSDSIDCRAIAKVPMNAPEKVHPVYLSSIEIAKLRQDVKYEAKLTKEAAGMKQRIESNASGFYLGALDAFGDNKFCCAGRVFFEHFFNPWAVVAMGRKGFEKEFRDKYKKVTEKTLDKLFSAAVSTTKIYQGRTAQDLSFDINQVADQIKTDLRLMQSIENEIDKLMLKIEAQYKRIDPKEYLRSIQGIGKKIAPALLGLSGDVSRFTAKAYSRFCGFVPTRKGSGNSEKEGLPMNKAAQSLLKQVYYMAAETARQYDAECAALYNRLLDKGRKHIEAVCAVAHMLSRRVYALLLRMQKAKNSLYLAGTGPVPIDEQLEDKEVVYKFRNFEGNVISKKQARKLVTETFPTAEERKKMKKQNSMGSKKKQVEKGEKTISQAALTGLTRQLSLLVNENSTMRDDQFLPVSVLLDNTMNSIKLQYLKANLSDDKSAMEALEVLENFSMPTNKAKVMAAQLESCG